MDDRRAVSQEIPHTRPDGRYRNPWPGGVPRGFAAFIRWYFFDRPFQPPRKAPTPAEFRRDHPPATPSFAPPRAADDAFTVTWIGHTSFLVQFGGVNILLDPVWGDRASPIRFAGPKRWTAPGIEFETLPAIDLVIISHDHYDHLDLPTVRRLVRTHPDARWVAPIGVGAWLRRRGATVAAELDWWQTTQVGEIELGCTPAQHFSGRGLNNRDATLWCGWTIRGGTGANARTVFFAGDTARHPEFGAITSHFGPFDAVIFPIGAYDPRWIMSPVHMDPDQAVDSYADVVRANGDRPCVFIASHWGTFKLTTEPMDEPPRVTRDAWQRAGFEDHLLWILRHGETRIIAELPTLA